MREGWVSDILTNCIKLKSGNNLTARQMVPGDFPVYGGNGIAGFHKDWNLESENLIIGRVGALCGNARFVNERIWLTDNAFRVSEFKYDFDLEYLTFLLNYVDLRSYARQAAQPVISNSSLEKVVLTFPISKTEQQQIVAILDEAFSAINQAKANIEKNIQNAKELFQSKLNEIFSQKGDGWEEKTFHDLSTRIGDGLHGTPKYDDNGEYFFINGNNLTNGRIEIKEGTKRINKEEYLLHKRELNENTVLVSINGTLGNVAFFNNEPVILGKSACYINFKPEVDKHYVKFLIKSPLFFKNMSEESTGATIKNFSLKSMRNYKFHVPPKNLQIEIVKNLEKIEDEIDSLICSLEKKSMNMDELKKSILQKAFSGELNYKLVHTQ